jgi:lysozyme family protein
MTKQTDRLTKLEVKMDNVIDGLNEIKETLTDYIKEAQKGMIDCNIIQSSTGTQTRIQWYFLGALIMGLIGLGFKSIGG